MTPHEQIELMLQQTLQPKQAIISRIQDRAGTMAAVIATIMGIGLPLIVQPQTDKYFHVIPFCFLLTSFLFFYFTFTRTSSITISNIKIEGLADPIPYKKTALEKVISWNKVFNKSTPSDARHQLEKQIIWRTALSQMGHSFFLTAIAMEIVDVVGTSITWRSKFLQIVAGLILVAAIKVIVLSSITYTNTEQVSLQTGNQKSS